MQNPNILSENATNLQCAKKIIKIPFCYQETEYTCGVACLQSVLACYGMYYRQSALADVLHTQPILGTDYKSILYFSELLGLNAKIVENLDIDDLKEYIDKGVTPILIIQAWRLEDDIGYPIDWKNAHYIVACGYYFDGIYAMDPNILGNYAFLPYHDLQERWHAVDKDENRHIKCALIIQNKEYPVVYDSDKIKYIR
jgi:ABC-type bacteriocin/lantibiotic exporters, contain an N-terminal double-glycine peptidase domain